MTARIRLLVAGAAALLVAGWWAFPTLARDSDRLDVLLVGDGQVSEVAEPLQRRVRELGMSVQLVEADPCATADQIVADVARLDPSILVVSAADPAACGPALWSDVRGAVGGDVRLIALLQPGRSAPDAAAMLRGEGVEVADATRLLGAATADASAPTRIGCEWWDDCEPDGQVTIRDESGALTYAGGERLARTLAGVLP